MVTYPTIELFTIRKFISFIDIIYICELSSMPTITLSPESLEISDLILNIVNMLNTAAHTSNTGLISQINDTSDLC